jgi:phenylalanyl-tRNA synthetase beta chain
MAIVAFDLKDFKKTSLPQQKLVDEITRMGIDIDSITGSEMKVDISPNRPDLLDFVGFARALDNFVGKKVPKDNFYKISGKPALTIAVKKEVSKVRPYIAGIVVKNVDLSGNSLKYLINFTEKLADTYGRKRKKIAIGVHSLSAIKGDLTYTASKDGSFAPLGASTKSSFAQIMREHEKGVEYRDTIPNYDNDRMAYPYLADSEKIIAMIPITNSEATKVTEKTKELFIDITGTSMLAIENAANVIACSFMYSGADVYPVSVKYSTGTATALAMKYREIKVSMKKADRTIGVETGRHNVISLANRMGYTAAKYGDNVLFYVPPYRVDVLNDQDIIEDIAIAYGYNKINPSPVSGTGYGLSNDMSDMENSQALLMVGLGYTEAINSVLTNEQMNFKNMRWTYHSGEYVSIADAKTTTITMLRTSTLPNLLQNLSISSKATMPQRLFEIGKVFSIKGGKALEGTRLGLASVHSKANFAEAKSAMEAIFQLLGGDFRIEPHDDPVFISGRCARAVADNGASAVFGEVHPEVLRNFKIEEPVVAAEIALNEWAGR